MIFMGKSIAGLRHDILTGESLPPPSAAGPAVRYHDHCGDFEYDCDLA